jgi:putative selenium metabolism hydrolase
MRDELISFAQELIRIKSISGNEHEIAQFCTERMTQWGFDDVYVDDYGSLVGIIRGRANRVVVLDGHLDTVEAVDPAGWPHDPFSGALIGDRIYGRGASDMKGALAAMILAARSFVQEKEGLPGSIVVTGTTWEEYFEGYTLGKIIEELAGVALRPGLVIIGEASDLNLSTGQRGRAEIVLETQGRSSHAANPEFGINAVYKMQPIIEALRWLRPPEDEFLGKGIYELTDIISSPYPGASVVPDRCRITIDRRLLVGETEENVLAPLKEILEQKRRKDPEFQGEVYVDTGELIRPDGIKEKVKKFALAWKMESDHPVVRAGSRALRSVGLPGEISHYAFCTNGSYSAGVAGIPTLGFGPSRQNMAHVVDEYIETPQLEMAYRGYRALIQSYFNN